MSVVERKVSGDSRLIRSTSDKTLNLTRNCHALQWPTYHMFCKAPALRFQATARVFGTYICF